MIPTLIYLIEAIRRAMQKASRGLVIAAEAYQEAMEDWRRAARKYPFAE